MTKKVRPSVSSRVSVGAVVVATLAAGYALLTWGTGAQSVVPAYEVERVIDGDTFVTKEKQVIRLSSVEAPELDTCGGEAAKRALEKKILGKSVYLKIVYLDPYDRMVSLVYTPDLYINAYMIQQGYAYYLKKYDGESGDLKAAGKEAREKKRGIFSSTCTQEKNPSDPTCAIKGNIREEQIYYTPQCEQYYHQTKVELYKGDRWFCTEKEAQSSGFRKSGECE